MRLRLSAIAAIALTSSLAAAASTFTFTLTSNGMSGSGTLTGTVDPFNTLAFDITSVTGTYGGSTLSLVTPGGNTQTHFNYPLGNPNGYTYDDVLYTTGNPVDIYGLLFYLNSGPNVVNLFYDAGLLTGSGAPTQAVPDYAATFSYSASVTPEPSGIALLGTGMLCVAGVVRRRFA